MRKNNIEKSGNKMILISTVTSLCCHFPFHKIKYGKKKKKDLSYTYWSSLFSISRRWAFGIVLWEICTLGKVEFNRLATSWFF